MMLEPYLLAPVIAQPALPSFSQCALDVESETLNQVAKQSDDAVLLGLRFKHDWISPEKRMARLHQVFSGTTPSGSPCIQYIEIPGKGHSTLTFDYLDAKSRGIDTRQSVLKHLQKQLL